MLIFLVVLALTFETIWHQCGHKADRSYSFGRLHDLVDSGADEADDKHVENHHQKHAQLLKELVNRAGCEFMILGFIAFCIFVFNLGGGFEWMVKQFQSGSMHLPKTEGDWLHAAEVVHINMFCGMCVYFLITTRVVVGCTQRIKFWEHLALRRKQHCPFKVHGRGLKRIQYLDSDLAEYIHWRQYFVLKIGLMLSERHDMLKDVVERIGVSEEALLEEESKLNVVQQFQDYVEREFNFGAYLAFSVEDGVLDTIRVHPITWSFMIVLFVLFALFARFLKLAITRLMPYFLVITAITMCTMKYVVHKKRQRIFSNAFAQRADAASGSSSKDAPKLKMSSKGSLQRFAISLHTKHHTEMLVLRCLQILLFLMSYVFARTALDMQLWKKEPLSALLYMSLFGLLFAVLLHALPDSVPLFLGIMAMPPYVDQTNFAAFCDVLFDGHSLLTRTPGVTYDQESLFPVAPSTPRGKSMMMSEMARSSYGAGQGKCTEAAIPRGSPPSTPPKGVENGPRGAADVPLVSEAAINHPVPDVWGKTLDSHYERILREWLGEVYGHDPSTDIDGLIARYKSCEDQLIEKVVRERGVAPPRMAGMQVKV